MNKRTIIQSGSVIVLAVVAVLLIICYLPCHKKEAGTQCAAISNTNPLPSWNNGTVKRAILDFVERTTTENSPDFIPVADRIACFDNDGTLWSEQPFYFQLLFAFDHVKALAPLHPEWKTKQPFKALLEGDMNSLTAGGEEALLALVAVSHSGMTLDEYRKTVKEWMSVSRHPETGRRYTEMVYQPMLELLDYLRANDYKTFIVSGGSEEFMRVWAEEVYGIPPYQIVGSLGGYRFEMKEGEARLVKTSGFEFINDKREKPVGIARVIGKQPVFTVGNSDGDYQMLQYTTTRATPGFGMIIHHTDAVREWAYDRYSAVGRLNKGLDSAFVYKWQVVDMKKEWKRVYPFDK